MKKVLLITMMLISNVMLTTAQDIQDIYIEDYPNNQTTCKGDGITFYVYAQTECEEYGWLVNGEIIEKVSPIIITPTHNSNHIHYFGCEGFEHEFHINYVDATVPESFTQIVWKLPSTGTTLTATLEGYSIYNWQGGPSGYNSYIYEVFEPGIYICNITNPCGSATQTFIVRDNVQIMSASVDPNTNKNLVTWETSPEQAEYISNVIINRDGVDMATVPYTDGQYLDNIGSDLAARIYTLKCVDTIGEQCSSLQRGTIHMAFLPDINGNVEMTWNQPELGGANIHVSRFEICEYDPNSNEISVVDFVSSVTTSYSCNQSMFDYGYPLIRAIIEDGRGEKDMLSNRTEEIVGLNEIATGTLRIYPNPSNGVFNIEGSGTLHIVNVLGQEIMVKEIEGKETVALPKGMYFVQLNGMTRKIVVE